MKLVRRDIKYIVFIPTGILFGSLYLLKPEITLLLAASVSFLSLILMFILEWRIERVENFERIDKNFTGMEINELNSRLQKEVEKVEELTKIVEDLKSERIQNSIRNKKLERRCGKITNEYIETIMSLSTVLQSNCALEKDTCPGVMEIVSEITKKIVNLKEDIEDTDNSEDTHNFEEGYKYGNKIESQKVNSSI